jgi:signal transduction histidine kinase
MARRLAFAILLTLGTLVSAGTACAENSDAVRHSDRSKVIILGAIAGVELLLIVSLLRKRPQNTGEEQARAARAEFGGRLIQAQEKERTRIARELHDDINQRMALLANEVERLIQAEGDGAKTERAGELREIWRLTNEIATDIQHLSHQLHPSKLHYLGLATAVRDLCHEFSRQHHIGVECNVQRLPGDLDEAISLSLFRTVQESLRNVARHSQAREAKVELTCKSGVIRLRISDDGVGFDPRRPENPLGLGLVSMGERLRSVGGQFSVWSHPGDGTQVEGTVPAVLKREKAAYSSV